MKNGFGKEAYLNKISPILEKIEKEEAVSKGLRENMLEKGEGDLSDYYKAVIDYVHSLTQIMIMEVSVARFSEEMLGARNDIYLNKARKTTAVLLSSLEKITGEKINIDFEEGIRLTAPFESFIGNLELADKLKVIGVTISHLINLCGVQSRWRWSLVDFFGRFVNCYKNCINFKALQKNLDASVAGFADRMELMKHLDRLCDWAAERYREKYELTNKQNSDMIKALDFVAFRKRLSIVMGDHKNVEECTKTYDAWNKIFLANLKEKEKEGEINRD